MKKAVRIALPLAAILLVVLAILWQNGAFSRDDPGSPAGTVKLVIRCDRALDAPALKEEIRAILPESGVMGAGEVPLYENDTAFTLLTRFCKKQKLALEYKGATRYGVYVEGIGGLYELDCGSESGWMFSVNGDFVSKSAGDTPVSDGDEILWTYTLDLGKDVGSREP